MIYCKQKLIINVNKFYSSVNYIKKKKNCFQNTQSIKKANFNLKKKNKVNLL